MPRYIDADRLKETIENAEYFDISQIDDAPTADVVDRKKGKWVNRWSGDGSVWLEEICSECGLTFEDEPHGYNYCPNCGAEMRGESDGEA